MADANKNDGALDTAYKLSVAAGTFVFLATYNAGVGSQTRVGLFFNACLAGGGGGALIFLVLKFLVQLMGKDK